MPESNLAALTDDLFRIGAVKFGAFKLKLHDKNPNAPLSPIYIDLRLLRSDPKARTRAVEALQTEALRLEWDMLADVPTAATPIVAILADRMQRGMLSPRKDEKSHGISQQVDGIFVPGQKVLLVDDLITKADSKLEAISALERNGLRVSDVLVLVDREQGGGETLRSHGYSLHRLMTLDGILSQYAQRGFITADQLNQVRAYLATSATT